MASRGDILYRGASVWKRLVAGTAGYVLQTNGASADPTWVQGVLLSAPVALTNAQIKALPTTGIPIIAAAGAGKVIRPIFAYFSGDFSAGAYTNIDTTYATVQLETNGQWAAAPVVNDSTSTPALAQVSAFLSAHVFLYEMPVPFMEGATTGGTAWITGNTLVNSSPAFSANQPLSLVMDNNGTGNLTGGHVANTLTVRVVYVVLG